MIADPVKGVVDIEAGATIQRVAVAVSESGNGTLVAAVAGKKVKVLGALLVGAGDVSVKFVGGSTDLTGAMPLSVAGNGLVMPMTHRGYHWLETAAGAALALNLSESVAVAGVVVYLQE